METVEGDTADPKVEPDFRAALKFENSIEKLERFDFYRRAEGAFAIVVTGEVCLHLMFYDMIHDAYEVSDEEIRKYYLEEGRGSCYLLGPRKRPDK